jgi:hypothetical protein
VINDLGVLTDSRKTFVIHIESILSKSARIMGFIKRISKEYASCCGRLIKRFIRRGLSTFNTTL